MSSHGIFVVLAACLAVAGCSASPPAITTPTVTAKPVVTPKINTAFFVELQRLDDKFVAQVTAVPNLRSEIMDRRGKGAIEMAGLAHDLCMHPLAEQADGGPEMALRLAGTYLEFSMFIAGEPMSDFVKQVFVRAAANTFCRDNPAGVH